MGYVIAAYGLVALALAAYAWWVQRTITRIKDQLGAAQQASEAAPESRQ